MPPSAARLLLLTVAIGHSLSQALDLTDCSLDSIQSCGADFIPYYNSTHLAEDPESLEKQCGTFIGQLECAENFTLRCLRGVARAGALEMLRTTLAIYEESCNRTSEAYQAYLRSIPCINRAGPKLHLCVNGLLAALRTTIDEVPHQQKIKYGCCQYYGLLDCNGRALREKCGKQEVIGYLKKTVQDAFGDILDLACGSYKRGSAACKTVPPLPSVDTASEGPVNILKSLGRLVHSLG